MTNIFLRWPIINFLLLGFGLWLGYQEFFPQRPQILITDRQFSWTLADWHRQYFRKPTVAERQELLQQTIEEEVLYQQALAQGLQYSSPVQRRIQNLQRYIGESSIGDASTADNQDSVAKQGNSQQQWAQQHFIANDPVIRRFLVATLKEHILKSSKVPSFTEPQLRTYYQNHTDIFSTPARFAFHHIYFGGFEQSSIDRANNAFAMLATAKISVEQAIKYGDAFYGGHYLAPSTQQHIQQQLGGDMGKAITKLDSQQWSGPIRSAYGWHLVYIVNIIEKSVTEFADLREKINTQLRQESQQKNLAKELEELIQRYDVTEEVSFSLQTKLPE